MTTQSDYKYFVMRFEGRIFRVYGTRNFYPPAEGDPRCVWIGNDIESARKACREANAKRETEEAVNAPRLFS